MRKKVFIVFSLLIITGIALGACVQPTPTPALPTHAQTLAVSQLQPAGPTVIVLTATPEPTAPPLEFKSKDPATYVSVRIEPPESLDPARSYEPSGGHVILNTHDTLIFYDREDPSLLVPMLRWKCPAWKMEVSPRMV